MKRLLVMITIIACTIFLVFALNRKNTRLLVDFNPIIHPDVVKVEKMINSTGVKVPSNTKKKIALAIAENARYYGIKPKTLVAIAFVESSFQPKLINDSGDHGLMQINWPTWKGKFTNNPNDLLNVYKNVEIACKIININKSMGYDDVASYHSFNTENKAKYSERLRLALGRM